MNINNYMRFRQSRKNDRDAYDSDTDDDKIITATITFDLTVDQSTGQVLNATEGQVISETHISPVEGITLSEHIDHQTPRYKSSSLRDEESSKSDSVSTTTKSLIDKSKKYVKDDDGIIILKKDKTSSSSSSMSSNRSNPNLSIKLDFDVVADDYTDDSSSDQFNINEKTVKFQSPKKNKKLYNINLDLDLDNKIISTVSTNNTNTYFNNNDRTINDNSKDFNDLDISLTKTTTIYNENFEIFDESIDENLEEEMMIKNDNSINKSRSTPQSQYKNSNKSVSFKDVEEYTITPSNSSTSSNENEKNDVNLVKSKLSMGDPSRSNTVLSQNSRFDRISRLIENASEKNNLQEKNQFYSEQISSYPNRNMSINDCIEQSLRNDKNKDYPVLQSFQTLDINALTQGFQREELNEEGKLVLYITEKQLLQLLNQRAIIVPNKQEILESKFKEKKFSLIDETVGHRFGRKTPIKEVELVVDQENIKRVYSKDINSNDSKSVTYCFKSNDNYKPSTMTYTDNNSNTNKNNNNNYDSLDSFDISMHKGSNLTQLDQSFEKTTSKITPYTKYNRKSGSYFSITEKNPDDYVYAQVNEYVNESMRTSCLYENDLTDKDEAKKMANIEEIQIISHQSTVANDKIDTYDINETYYDDTLNLRKMNSKMSKGDSVEVFESFDNNKNKYKIAFLDDKSHSQDVNRQSQEMDGTISPNKSSDAFDIRTILKKETNLNELIKKNNNDFRSMEHLQQHEQYDLFSQNKNGISNLDYGFDNITEVQKVSKYHEYLNDSNGYVSKIESEFKSEFHSAYEDKLANKKMIDNNAKIEDERNLKSKLSIDEFDATKETSTSKNEEALVLSQLDEFFTKLLESQYQKKTSSPQGKKLSFIDESFDSIESFDIGKLRRDSLTENLVNNEKNEPANPPKPVYSNLYSNDTTENSAKKGPCSVKSTESFSKKSNGKFSYTSTIDPKTIRTNSNFKKQLQSSQSSRDQQKSQNTAEKTSKLESSEAIELDQKTCKELDELLTKLKKTYNKQTKRVDRKNVSLSKDEISKLIKFFSRPFDPNDTLNSNTLSKFSSLNKRPSFMEKDSEIEALKKLDEFVCKTLSRNKEVANKLFSPKQAINSISSIDAIDDLIEKSKQILNNWNDNIKNSTAISSKKSTAGNSSTGLNKTRVTINEPIKQKVTSNNKSSNASKPPCVLRKKITYAYIDDYNPTTRVYEVADFNNDNSNSKINTSRYQKARDVLNPKTNVCNNRQFDPQIQNSFGKPALPHLDKFLSGVQNDIKNNIKKINPSVESTFKFQNKYNPSFQGNKNNAGRVLVESEGYNNYIDEVTKNFTNLKVTDFPIYVNNLTQQVCKMNEPIKLMRNGNKITEAYCNNSNFKQRN